MQISERTGKASFAKLICGVALLGVVANAQASLDWTWSFHSDDDIVYARGNFTTTDVSPDDGSYSIISDLPASGTVTIAGFVADEIITGVVAPGGFDSNDNILPSADTYPLLSGNGFTFSSASGYYNICGYGGTYFFTGVNLGEDELFFTGPGTFTLTPELVPEPINIALAVFGFGMVGLVLKRHFKKAA